MVGGILEITEDINGSYEVVLAIAASATVVAVASFVRSQFGSDDGTPPFHCREYGQ